MKNKEFKCLLGNDPSILVQSLPLNLNDSNHYTILLVAASVFQHPSVILGEAGGTFAISFLSCHLNTKSNWGEHPSTWTVTDDGRSHYYRQNNIELILFATRARVKIKL